MSLDLLQDLCGSNGSVDHPKRRCGHTDDYYYGIGEHEEIRFFLVICFPERCDSLGSGVMFFRSHFQTNFLAFI